MKFLNILVGFIFIGIGVKNLIDKKISLKGNIINLGDFSYLIGFVCIVFGVYIFYLIYNNKDIEL